MKGNDPEGAFTANMKAKHLLAQAAERLEAAFVAQQRIIHEQSGSSEASAEFNENYKKVFAVMQKSIERLREDLKRDAGKMKGKK